MNAMFRPGFDDLVKPQWLAVIRALKLSGRKSTAALARELGAVPMTVKRHCEELCRLGYLERLRAPRPEVGRPEVAYRLSARAERLFPGPGQALALELLDGLRELFGEAAVDRLLYHHFQQVLERWQPRMARAGALVDKAALLCTLREKEGHCCRCRFEPEKGLWIEEYHHPLAPVFRTYPHAVGMELKVLEALLGARVERREIHGGAQGPARVDYHI